MIQQNEDHEIIQDILAGKSSRYEEIVNKYKKYVYTITFRILTNSYDAEEASQDVFVKAYKGLPKFKKTSKFSTWLYRIAFNTAVSYKRKSKMKTTDIDHIKIIKSVPEEDSLENQDRSRLIQKTMNKLLPLDATLLTLFYLKEMSLQEISEVTNLKTNAIKVKLFRARKRMAKEMSKLVNNERASLI